MLSLPPVAMGLVSRTSTHVSNMQPNLLLTEVSGHIIPNIIWFITQVFLHTQAHRSVPTSATPAGATQTRPLSGAFLPRAPPLLSPLRGPFLWTAQVLSLVVALEPVTQTKAKRRIPCDPVWK